MTEQSCQKNYVFSIRNSDISHYTVTNKSIPYIFKFKSIEYSFHITWFQDSRVLLMRNALFWNFNLAYIGGQLPTCREKLWSQVLGRSALDDGGRSFFAETSVCNYQSTLRNIQEEPRSCFLSLYKDNLVFCFLTYLQMWILDIRGLEL